MRETAPATGIYYGWIVLIASVVAMAVGSGISFWSFGLYVDPLESDFGWSRAEVSAGISVSLGIGALSGPLIGRWIDSSGPRVVIIAGAFASSATFLLLATTTELWQWFVYLSINTVARQMVFFLPFQALVSRWFERKRGLAVGILGSGFSFGGLAIVPLMAFVIDRLDWDGSFVFAAALTLALFLPMGLLVLRNDPADVGANMDGDTVADGETYTPAPLTGLTLRQTLRTPLFWLLAAAMTLFIFGIVGWIVHQVPFYESVGVSRGLAAGLVSIAAGGGVIMRLTFGVIADRVPRIEVGAMGLLAFLVASMAVLLVDSGIVGISIFVVLWVIGSGGGPLLEPLLLGRAFGLKHFATILATMMLIDALGVVTAPTIAGLIYDETGSYDLVLVMFGSSFAAALALFYLASRLPHPMQALPLTEQFPEPRA
ncbi:MAG TPA: MFS transporter [Dehalococcoidia bacterium]|nr:MFS transporter [Dehalococcoidia bacterium]